MSIAADILLGVLDKRSTKGKNTEYWRLFSIHIEEEIKEVKIVTKTKETILELIDNLIETIGLHSTLYLLGRAEKSAKSYLENDLPVINEDNVVLSGETDDES